MLKQLFIFFVFFPLSISGHVIDKGLKELSFHEKACMKTFFVRAMQYASISHVLFYDNKPMCIIPIIIKHKGKSFSEIQSLDGWQIFKKYEQLFPHNNFIFNTQTVEFSQDFKVLHIYLINKKALENCLDQYLPFFDQMLGSFSKKTFIEQLETGCPLATLINKNDFLLGILLGFGRESSKAYMEMNSTITSYDEPYCGIEVKNPKGCKFFPITFMAILIHKKFKNYYTSMKMK